MGAQGSKELTDELSFQSEEEKKSVLSSFDAVASEDSRKCSKNDLQAHWLKTLDNALVSLLIDYLFPKGSNEGINFKMYALLYLKFIQGAPHEEVIALISNTKNSANVSTDNLMKYVRSIVNSYIKAHKESPKFQSWHLKLNETTDSHIELFVNALMRDIIYGSSLSGKETFSAKTPPSRDVSLEEIETWLNKSSEIIFMQTDLLLHIYRPEEDLYCKKGILIPSCLGIPSHLMLKSVLDATSLIFLTSSLPPEYRNEWHFLFSSAIHGESFSKLLGCISNKGPTIIVIVDNGGNIFGGFAPVCWEIGPKFVGNDSSFLFSLSPKMGIYNTTGYNDHFMYLNIQQQTLPNGLGMGGQFDYFGFWLDAEFGKGSCSQTCTTFDSPPLSSAKDFEIRHLEVWAVGKPPPTPQELGERPSVLDGNYEAKALLSMAGKEEHSLGYREPEDLDL